MPISKSRQGLHQPTAKDVAIFKKYLDGVVDGNMLTSIALESKLSSLGIGAVATVVGVEVDFVKFMSLNNATLGEIESCLKVLMYSSPSNCTKYLDAIARCLFKIEDAILESTINTLLPMYCYYPTHYKVDYHIIRKEIITGRNTQELDAKKMEYFGSILSNFVSEVRHFCGLHGHPLCQITEKDGNFYVWVLRHADPTFSSNVINNTIVLKIDSQGNCLKAEGLYKSYKISPRRAKSMGSNLYNILCRLSSDLPFELENIYFYPLDRYEDLRQNTYFIKGFLTRDIDGKISVLLI